ncbi:MAG: ubiquinone biosynthesis accessory factor UbiJ [Sinimarinibacterium flocculans]|uniref:ubiquinone biosynthesis accessory factor UbiJ n=1 Tax=Sinimarinibacterium flocculans TaxID=985250 RepID=UPI0024918B20|nr:SCP2 sterol-binding domain-containing protein [Sinimarinibacterium flocculans]
MSAPAWLCAGMEIALNRHLALEPAVLAQCAKLSGRIIELRTETPDWAFCLEFHGRGVRVAPQAPREPDVRVRGRLQTLFQLALKAAREGGDVGIPSGLRVEGDVEPLQRFTRLLAEVGFDAEEFAARFVGDAAAHRGVAGLRRLFAWGQRSASTLALDTAEYLREETGDLARAADVADWAAGVETLRDDVARFEARLRRFEARARAA